MGLKITFKVEIILSERCCTKDTVLDKMFLIKSKENCSLKPYKTSTDISTIIAMTIKYLDLRDPLASPLPNALYAAQS